MDNSTIEIIKKFYNHDDPSHDWLHIERVTNTCLELATKLKANKKVLLPAAYLHDVINIPKNSDMRSQASKLAASKAKKILKDCPYSEQEIESIAQIIVEHSYSANIIPSSLESAILQDADKLDAMGAIGVMRWASCGVRMKAKYYHQNDPWGKERELDDRKFSLDHFEKKLLKLYERLNTEPAKIEGKKRLQFFKTFLAQLKSEI